METETPTTRPRVALDSDPHHPEPGRPLRLAFCFNGYQARIVDLSVEDLRAIAQLAYDQHGILAEPSLDREAERGNALVHA